MIQALFKFNRFIALAFLLGALFVVQSAEAATTNVVSDHDQTKTITDFCYIEYVSGCSELHYTANGSVTVPSGSGITCSGTGCGNFSLSGNLNSSNRIFSLNPSVFIPQGSNGTVNYTCTTHASAGCGVGDQTFSGQIIVTPPTPTNKQFYVCQTSNICNLTSQSYPDRTACEAANPGKSCYNQQSQCLANAPTECPAPQKRCQDNNGDGYADACQINGNLPQSCDNVSQCPQPPQKRCQDNNGDGYADACQINGNLPQSCDNVSQCPQPPQKRCQDNNGDGYADACQINGNLPQSCSTVADCPAPPQQKRCQDNNADGYADACQINGNLPQSCSTVADCPAPPQQKRCQDNNGDGYADACQINGNLPQSCSTVADCPAPPQQKRCQDNNGDGYADACQINGNLPQSCSTVTDCPAPPQQKRCYDSNYDGTFDQCTTNGTGPNCQNFTQDCQPQTHKECRNNACTVVTGAGSNQCVFDGDCQPQTHKECRNNACTVINGAGSNLCLFDTDCAPQTHKECLNNACTVINGPGSNQCNFDGDCAPQTHRECQNQQCVSVNGPGTNQCASNNDCQVQQTHRECQNQQCVTVNGAGSNQCSTSSDCQVQQSHLECRNQQCVSVSGGGSNLCTSNSDCQVQQSHRECRNEQCVTVSGAGSNLCTFNSDCQVQQSHRECRNEQCVTVSGPGSNLCTFNSDCQVQQSHRECRNEQCVTVSGSGFNQCSSNNDCQPAFQTFYYCNQNQQQCSGSQYRSLSECQSSTGKRCFTNSFECSTNALTDTQCQPATRCGDGRLQRPNSQGQMEECDDGNNTDDRNGCTADCRLTSIFQNRCNDSNGDGKADSCSSNGNMATSCNVLSDCLQAHVCTACGCVEKNVSSDGTSFDGSTFAGDNQTVTYRVVISNKSDQSPASYTPYEIQVRDFIFQKKKFRENDPVKGLETSQSTEGYIEFPSQVCIKENPTGAQVLLNSGSTGITSGCFNYTPGSNIGDPTSITNNTAPAFLIRNLTPGNYITFEYKAAARTSFPGHELASNTDFIDITNEVRTQTNNDYANVTVSKPALLTSNLGNLFIGGADPLESVNISNLARMFSSANPLYDPDNIRNITGLIVSPGQAVGKVSTYLASVGQYLGFDSEKLSAALGESTAGIIKNSSGSLTSTIASEEQFKLLGQRPDKVRIFTSSGPLTVNLGSNETLKESSTIVVEKGDLTILGDIKYAPSASTQGKLPSIAFVVLEGNINIGTNVGRLDGVYVIKDNNFKFTGQKVAKQLIINGSIIGDSSEILKVRTYVGAPDSRDSGGSVIVRYDARITASSTPPGLSDILGDIFFQQIAK